MVTQEEKSCRNCIFEIWAVGLGHGILCIANENEGKDFGFGQNKTGKPLGQYGQTFVCEHWIAEKDG